jgi:hypothetical protein
MPKVKNNQHETQPGKKSNRSTKINKHLPITALNVSGLNSPIKRHC